MYMPGVNFSINHTSIDFLIHGYNTRRRTKTKKMPFYVGQHTCSGHKKSNDPCTHAAYYVLRDRPVCGRHNEKPLGRKMRLDPAAVAARAQTLQDHATSVQATARESRGAPGTVTCYKMRMMAPVPLTPGVQLVFPNSKHGGRRDGLGMPALSPMRNGPVNHPQPGLPPARSIENFHQGSKWFSTQTFEEFRATQRQMFADRIPHRHHPEASKVGQPRNIPKCFVWTRPDGAVIEYTYVQSRQFYCHYLERALRQQPDFATLERLLAGGTNLCLCGYDAYQPSADIMAHYLDASRPFGHELVIYTMLVHDEAEWPWRKHKTEEY